MAEVGQVSSEMQRHAPRYAEYDELFGYGCVGLITALNDFDSNQASRFSYVKVRIRGAVVDWLRSIDPLSRDGRRRYNFLRKAKTQLSHEKGKEPTLTELVDWLNKRLSVVEQACNVTKATRNLLFALCEEYVKPKQLQRRVTKFETNSYEGEESREDSYIQRPNHKTGVNDEATRAKGICYQEFSDDGKEQEFTGLLVNAGLTDIEHRIVWLHYHEGLTKRAIGKVINLSESRVCQIEKKARDKIETRIKEKGGSIEDLL